MLKTKHLKGALRVQDQLDAAAWKAANDQAPKPQPSTHEARRYCKGDGSWTTWQPCTTQQAEMRRTDDTFQVRLRTLPNTN